jgi:hypothetical protein
MAKIYGLFTGDLCFYVGSTVRRLSDRLREHRSDKNDCASKHISNEYEWEIKLLEECPIDDILIREQHWYDILMPLYNVFTPKLSPRAQRRRDAEKKRKLEHSLRNKN